MSKCERDKQGRLLDGILKVARQSLEFIIPGTLVGIMSCAFQVYIIPFIYFFLIYGTVP